MLLCACVCLCVCTSTHTLVHTLYRRAVRFLLTQGNTTQRKIHTHGPIQTVAETAQHRCYCTYLYTHGLTQADTAGTNTDAVRTHSDVIGYRLTYAHTRAVTPDTATSVVMPSDLDMLKISHDHRTKC